MPVESAVQGSRAEGDGRTPCESAPAGPHAVAGPGPPVNGRIRRPGPCAVRDQGIIVGHVGEQRLRGDDRQQRTVPLDQDLLVGAQRPRLISALAQVLHRIHHLPLLAEESLPQRAHPVVVGGHLREHLRKGGQRLHARIPAAALRRLHSVVALQPRVRLRPARGIGDLLRISRRHQDLREQRVGIQRNRREHLVELPPAVGRALPGRRRILRLGRRQERLCERDGRPERDHSGRNRLDKAVRTVWL